MGDGSNPAPGENGASARIRRIGSVAYDVNAFGQVTTIKHGLPHLPHLLHSCACNSRGNVDRYTDPMQCAQTFPPDALGCVVEHVRLGDGTSAIRTTGQFDDVVAPDDRTKVTRADVFGNLTITHQDFAGRAFVVLLVCTKCAGPRRVLAAINDPSAIARVLGEPGRTAAGADPSGCRATPAAAGDAADVGDAAE